MTAVNKHLVRESLFSYVRAYTRSLYRVHGWEAGPGIGGRGILQVPRLWRRGVDQIPDIVGRPDCKTLSYVDLWNLSNFLDL